LIDRVLQGGKIVGAAVEALGGEVRHWTVDCAVDLVTCRQALLSPVQFTGQLLQQQEIAADTAGQLNVIGRHLGSPECVVRLRRSFLTALRRHSPRLGSSSCSYYAKYYLIEIYK
jgi:hypothetical protein